jgi:hypothetical protein
MGLMAVGAVSFVEPLTNPDEDDATAHADSRRSAAPP